MKKSWVRLILIVVTWIVSLLLVSFLSIKYLPFTPSFPYYNTDLLPHYSRELAAFAHFDGIHYLRLIHHGYDDTGSQAFFPVYPLFVRFLTFGRLDPLSVAIVLNILLLVSSLLIMKAKPKFLLLFLTFPASFFLLTSYTESLFIFLVILFFLLCKNKQFFFAAIVAGIASATRVVGIFLAFALLIELIQSHQKPIYIFSLLLLSISGLAIFSAYLFSRWGDPLMFVHVQSLFGAGRSDSQIILLPQVLYRYVRMLATTPALSLTFLRAAWELSTFSAVCFALVWVWRRLLLPAAIFCAGVILFPSLSGTLSSFTRYSLVAIPLFIAVSDLLSWKSLGLISLFQYAMLAIALALFVQGVFVA